MSTTLYLIPTLLGNDEFERSIPSWNLKIIDKINLFVVENEKSARRFIKTILPNKKQADLEIHILDKNTSAEELHELTQLFRQNEAIGILSEAGLPVVADPGSKLVRLAHKSGVKVVPLVGASSIMLALMASGMNGQNFSFHGYLPIDKAERKKAIQNLEVKSRTTNSTQIFMETPYRNNQLLEDLIKYCQPSTLICVAVNLTMDDEVIQTLKANQWAQKKTDFHKKPAIFLLEST